MKKKRWLLLPLLAVLVVVAYYSYEVLHFQKTFVNKTTIGNVDVSQLSKSEAKVKLTKNVEDEFFTITDKEKEWKKIPTKELGLSYDMDKTVDNALSQQNPLLWFTSFFKTQTHSLVANSINSQSLDASITKLEKDMTESNKKRTKTENASIQSKDGAFVIVPEVIGDTLDVKKASAELKKDILAGKNSFDLSKHTQKPTILASDASLKKKLDAVKDIAEIDASYSIGGEEVVIPKEELASWVMFKDGEVTLNDDLVREYVTKLGDKYNTSTNPTNFKSTKRGEVSVPSGAYSWTIATDSEVEQLKEVVLQGESFSGRVPAFVGSGTPAAPMVGNTYIEVDIQAQHMWYYKDGKVALETPVITGKPSTPTPPGMFYVWNKVRDTVLTGGEIPSPVDFWMPIDWTGVGIHDSDWQAPGSYGGTSYKTVGSHGCINTPPSVCKELFNMIDVGVPVVIF